VAPAKSKAKEQAYTGKGTKQRSFQLNDEAFAVVEMTAVSLGVTNSAALAVILFRHRDGAPAASTAVPPAQPAVAASPLIPDHRTTEFKVSDPANDFKGDEDRAPSGKAASVRDKTDPQDTKLKSSFGGGKGKERDILEEE
jgi:hypothetical protein